jgi:tripartite-type tricarboxylate transporter receptor subunit TctC
MFDVMSESIEYIRAGKLRALAMTSARRSNAHRTFRQGDFRPDFEANIWFNVGVPKNTPGEMRDARDHSLSPESQCCEIRPSSRSKLRRDHI